MLSNLTVVVPCYNEEQVLLETNKQLTSIINDQIVQKLIGSDSRILYVDDGSYDNTWSIIEQLSDESSIVTGLKFSRNFGHQNALLAGLEMASKHANMAITIDADLQDDVNIIPRMVEAYSSGNDVVYAVRNNRDTDTFFKRKTAKLFYGTMKKMGVDMIPNHADYRLMSNRAIKGLLKYSERNLFLRGIVPLIGYQSTKVYYARKKRFAGTSKYPLKKMLSFAMDGITSFSIAPIRMIMYLGVLIVLMSVGLMIYTLVSHVLGNVTPGWSSLMISIWFIGGVQLLALSVLGEYIGKIFTETKKRPRFEIEKDKYSSSFKND